MKLHVRLVERIHGPRESAAFYGIAREQATATEQIPKRRERVRQQRRQTQRIALIASAVMHPDSRVIVQVGSDA